MLLYLLRAQILTIYCQSIETEIVRLFPQSRARVIQGAGHWLHAEKTVAFNRSVESFLGSH